MKEITSLLAASSLLVFSNANAANEIQEPDVCNYVANIAYSVNRNLNDGTIRPGGLSPFADDFLVKNLHWYEASEQGAAVDDCDADAPFEYCQFPYVQSFLNQEKDNNNVFAQDATLHELYYRWTHLIGYLPYAGHIYRVNAVGDYGVNSGGRSTGTFLSSVVDDRGLVCTFSSRIYESARTVNPPEKDQLTNRRGCQEIVTDKYVVAPTISIEAKKLYSWFVTIRMKRPGDFYLHGVNKMDGTGDHVAGINADIDGDRKPETLVGINYSTGGASCPFSYFELVKNDLSDFERGPLRDALLSVQGVSYAKGGVSGRCYTQPKLRHVDGHFFIEQSGLKASPDATGSFTVGPEVDPYDQGGPLTRKLYSIASNNPQQVCNSVFTVQPVVMFNRNSAQ